MLLIVNPGENECARLKGFRRQERRFSLTYNSSEIRGIDAARSRRGDFFTVDFFLAGLRPVHRLVWRH